MNNVVEIKSGATTDAIVNITITNGVAVELTCDKNMEFVSEVCRPLAGKWNSKRACWSFTVEFKDRLLDGCKEFFTVINVHEVTKDVTDRKSDTRRKIILGAAVLKTIERMASDDSEHAGHVRDFMADIVDNMSTRDRVLFPKVEYTSPVWQWVKGEGLADESEATAK